MYTKTITICRFNRIMSIIITMFFFSFWLAISETSLSFYTFFSILSLSMNVHILSISYVRCARHPSNCRMKFYLFCMLNISTSWFEMQYMVHARQFAQQNRVKMFCINLYEVQNELNTNRLINYIWYAKRYRKIVPLKKKCIHFFASFDYFALTSNKRLFILCDCKTLNVMKLKRKNEQNRRRKKLYESATLNWF